VSKFSKVSIFSDLNNLEDIRLNRYAADLVGYTQTELEQTFADHIAACLDDALAADRESLLAKVKSWYNGYTWDARTYVYNPFSILRFFKSHVFDNYLFQTGAPSLLIAKLKESGYFNLNVLEASNSLLESYSLDNLDARAS
jgi:Predicted AAA-ATPase